MGGVWRLAHHRAVPIQASVSLTDRPSDIIVLHDGSFRHIRQCGRIDRAEARRRPATIRLSACCDTGWPGARIRRYPADHEAPDMEYEPRSGPDVATEHSCRFQGVSDRVAEQDGGAV